jgi:hypothetical protein
MSTFDPTAIAGTEAELPPKDHNQPEPTPFEAVKTEIEDLFMEATNWCDGEAISSQEIHDQIEKLYDGLHAAGAKAEKLRVAEKEPFDTAIAEIQARFAPLIADNKSVKGKVTLGKQELAKLLTPWRAAKAAAAQAEAARVAAAAAEATRIATEAIRASSGNLAARESAEEQLADAKRLEKTARRWDKAATTGTGLRTTYRADLVSIDEALDHYWTTSQARFEDLVRELAAADVRAGKRAIPGFTVVEVKVAS